MEEKDETEIPRERNNEPKTAIAVAGAWVSWDDCDVNTEKVRIIIKIFDARALLLMVNG